MAMEMPDPVDGLYCVTYVFPIDDVQAKITSKATLTSPQFTSQEDPNPGHFELEVDFGAEVEEGHGAEENCLGIFLRRHVKTATVKAFRFDVFDGEGRSIMWAVCDLLTKMAPRQLRGLRKLFTLDKINGGNIVITCFIQYYSHETNSPTEYIPNPQLVGSYADDPVEQLQDDYVELFESAEFADVTFLVGEKKEEVKAHKSILSARSSYFRGLFKAKMQESASNQIEVPDVRPAVFRAVLRFVYGGRSEEEEFDIVADMIVAADKYGLDDLKHDCEQYLRRTLFVEDVVDAFILSKRHNCPGLLKDAKALFEPYAGVLREDEANRSKLTNNPDLFLPLAESLVE